MAEQSVAYKTNWATIWSYAALLASVLTLAFVYLILWNQGHCAYLKPVKEHPHVYACSVKP